MDINTLSRRQRALPGGDLDCRPPPREAGVAVIDRHFRMQSERPPELRGIEIAAVDSLLRLLLLSDGSITPALAAHSLAPVVVDLIDQAPATAPLASRWLAGGPDERPLRRRVVTALRRSPRELSPSGFAESFLLPERLPADFLPVLLASPAGIGDALGRLQLEVRRELLWFGLGTVPPWAAPDRGESLVRGYRIVTGGRPAIFISEGFRVALVDGCYALRPGRSNRVETTPAPAAGA
jgi:chorismate-pyruvate lyase